QLNSNLSMENSAYIGCLASDQLFEMCRGLMERLLGLQHQRRQIHVKRVGDTIAGRNRYMQSRSFVVVFHMRDSLFNFFGDNQSLWMRCVCKQTSKSSVTYAPE